MGRMADTKKYMCGSCRTDSAAWCDFQTVNGIDTHTHVCEACGQRVSYEGRGPACSGPVIAAMAASLRPSDEVYERQAEEFQRAGEALGKRVGKTDHN